MSCWFTPVWKRAKCDCSITEYLHFDPIWRQCKPGTQTTWELIPELSVDMRPRGPSVPKRASIGGLLKYTPNNSIGRFWFSEAHSKNLTNFYAGGILATTAHAQPNRCPSSPRRWNGCDPVSQEIAKKSRVAFACKIICKVSVGL